MKIIFPTILFLFATAGTASPLVEISLYHDDGRCEESSLIMTHKFTGEASLDLKLCKFAVANLDERPSVWGIKVAGSCRDISDRSINGMCEAIVDAIENGRRL